MATKSRKEIKIKVPPELLDALAGAYELSRVIEMAHIPRESWESAAASWLSVNRDPNCWVTMHLDGKTQDFMYDLRFGHEADEKHDA